MDAVRFLTRVPLPGRSHGAVDLARSVPWFPMVGGLAGAVVAGVYAAATELVPGAVAAVVAVVSGLLLTGAFHEDGLADSADALIGAPHGDLPQGGLSGDSRVLRILRDPTLVLKATLWSAVLWLINALGFWFAFRAFDIDLPVSAAIFFQSCLALAVSVPSGPAFVGLFEGAALAVLGGLWGISEVKALAFGAGFHIAGFIPVTVIGLWFAYRLGLSLAGVASTEEVVEEAVERETGVDPEHPRQPPDAQADDGDGPTGA